MGAAKQRRRHRPHRYGRHPIRGRHLLTLLTAGLLVLPACGARWNGGQQEAVMARYESSGARGAPAAVGPEGSVSGGDARSTGSVATGDAGARAQAGSRQAGSSPSGTAGPRAQAAGARPCAARSDALGVTDSQVILGSISTLSGPVPGLGANAEAAVRAYAAYRNATGGVCGREIVVRSADDGMDNARYRSIVANMSDEVLGIMGGLAGGDAGGGDLVESEGMPAVVVAISDAMQNAGTVFDINPPFADVNQPIGKFDWLYDQGVRTAALVLTAVEQTRSEVYGKQQPQMEASGIRVVHTEEVPLSTLNYDSAARGVANSGADYLLFVADAGASASMARSMRNTGYELKSEEYLTAYGSNFIEAGGSATEGTVSWIRTLPNEDPNPIPEQAAFLEWMARAAPNAKADTFAADSWAAAKAFIDNLDALPGPISREALLHQLRSVSEYDADGFLGPIQLGANLNKGCHIAMQVKDGAWTRLTPATGFLC